MIKVSKTDMFSSPAQFLVNPVNCEGVMGLGLALEFKKLYPEMFKEYKETCARGELSIGQLHVWKDPTTLNSVINFPTKRHWRNRSYYSDIELGLIALRDFFRNLAPEERNCVIHVPALGCGLGGLKWEQVLELFLQHLSDLDPTTIIVFPPR